MNFIFSCSTRHLTRSLRSLVRCRVEHEKIKFISTSGHVIFCLLHKLLITTYLTIFRRIPTTFRRFPKIFQNCSEGKANVSEHFRRFSEDYRRFLKISEEAPMMFRSYSYISKYFFKGLWNHSHGDHCSNYGNHNDGDLFTCEDNMLSSPVKI